MKKPYHLLFILIFGLFASSAGAQTPQETELIELESMMARGVLSADIKFLQKFYAEDFVFTHGDGLVQTKPVWLSTVEQLKSNNLVSDRVTETKKVELHGDIAITTGRTTVTRTSSSDYWVEYVRVYRRKGDYWQMISHRTTRSSLMGDK